MKFNDEIIKYLNGDIFSNSLQVHISKSEQSIISRIELLKEMTIKKSVIHVGCCDHIPLIKQKIEKNNWLHKHIDNASRKCLGIDTDPEGVKYLINELGYENIIKADIAKEDIPVISDNTWDILLLGEVLEHIDNPVEFLSDIHKRYNRSINNIIVTVPNAFSLTNQKYIKNNTEIINSDHRYWFTPYTLAKVLTIAKFTINEFYFCREIPLQLNWKNKLKIKNLITRKKLRQFPCLRDIIVMKAKF